jgi:hypothetical protein
VLKIVITGKNKSRRENACSYPNTWKFSKFSFWTEKVILAHAQFIHMFSGFHNHTELKYKVKMFLYEICFFTLKQNSLKAGK